MKLQSSGVVIPSARQHRPGVLLANSTLVVPVGDPNETAGPNPWSLAYGGFSARLGRAEPEGARIALVDPVTPVSEMTELAAPWSLHRGFFEQLRRLAWIEGQNLLIERFSDEACAEHYPELARHVVDRIADLCIWAPSFARF